MLTSIPCQQILDTYYSGDRPKTPSQAEINALREELIHLRNVGRAAMAGICGGAVLAGIALYFGWVPMNEKKVVGVTVIMIIALAWGWQRQTFANNLLDAYASHKAVHLAGSREEFHREIHRIACLKTLFFNRQVEKCDAR